MAEVLTVDAILFGILVFSGILGNMLVIYTVRRKLQTPTSRLHFLELCSENRTRSTTDGVGGCQYFILLNR